MNDDKPTDINELFSRDPLDLTNSDVDAIIEKMRAMRHAWIANPGKKTTSTTLTAKQQATEKLGIKIEL